MTRKSGGAYQRRLLEILTAHSIAHTVKNYLPHSFTVIDSRIVWYSGGELFKANEDEPVLRIVDEVLAGELIAAVGIERLG